MEINVVDLFAGPGGLGEGFAAFTEPGTGRNPFRIRMSVEKEPSAHRTLTTRAFYRALKREGELSSYFDYVEGRISFDDLCQAHQRIFREVQQETLGSPRELGKDNSLILAELKRLKEQFKNQPWVVIGGPPCQAYSIAGRSRNKGVAGYRPEKDKRHFLYEEYLKVLAALEPDVFVMENVKGILTASVKNKGIFETIIEDLQAPGRSSGKKHGNGSARYEIHSFVVPRSEDRNETSALKPADFIVRAEDYLVPQCRHRVILLGIKKGNARSIEPLTPTLERIPIKPLLADLSPIRSKLSKETDSPRAWCEAIQQGIRDLRKRARRHVANDFQDYMDKQSKRISDKLSTRSSRYRSRRELDRLPIELKMWLLEDAPPQVLNHEARGHIRSDLLRYFFSACWGEYYAETPKASDFPDALRPAHANWDTGDFADRFRVQLAERPATTVTSHISKDGHYFIHFDSLQCRSLTVREAARIQTFPDNYLFEGNRTQQYVQVGNAVPPFLANQIAARIYALLSA